MTESVIHLHPAGPLLALVGNPNCGKTALFNRLTGSRQKVANYAGVTVERKEGRLKTHAGKTLRLLDLPGTYSLYPRSPDERVTCDVLAGRARGEKRPDLVICVLDATNLRRNLRLVLAVQRQGIPCVVALNMADLAASRGINIDVDKLSKALGLPVVRTIATQGHGLDDLRQLLEQREQWPAPPVPPGNEQDGQDQQRVNAILKELGLDEQSPALPSDKIDRFVLHPVFGPVLLAVLLFLLFQAVFSWAEAPKDWIESGVGWLGDVVGSALPEGLLKSLLVDGVIAGVGSVLAFLPQILILFFFILLLEESGYLPRAAFLLDRLMGSVGLSGRSFIPLLSSFACAIPGIMATRSIANPRDRLVTIMIAPLMTCSARLPVYALLIGAFVPQREVWGWFELQGLVLFVLYLAGIVGAMLVAWILKRFTSARQVRPLMMELPAYHLPHARNIAIGLLQRAEIFLKRVGGIILLLTLALWVLATFPGAPEGATGPAIQYSFAGMLGRGLEHVFAPIGFNWQISLALVPGLAAREIAISALGTVYALSATGTDAAAQALSPLIAQSWSLPTAFSLLAWFVFAPQCLATLAAVKRETGGLRMPLIMAGYLFALAYLAAFVTFRVSSYLLA
ncbi:ferrous iron transporter B [Paucibacter sp. APW11]|uniref:Ferrous iron transport protein B n=1 Tax=Roseateles aquae TaxID=3077235 RepID=A0ABU3P8S8_9BURK|nr:ferrous iron transporter B [Paucibacter sp. APW11]MDT8998980.1 ferrous iron transporter B [Paucibacter sp. APW11]